MSDEQLRRRMKAQEDNYKTWKQEADKLRDQLEWSLNNEEKYKVALNESFNRENELRAQCEKLAEALEYYHTGQCTWIDGSLNIAPAKQALAEYRKTKGK